MWIFPFVVCLCVILRGKSEELTSYEEVAGASTTAENVTAKVGKGDGTGSSEIVLETLSSTNEMSRTSLKPPAGIVTEDDPSAIPNRTANEIKNPNSFYSSDRQSFILPIELHIEEDDRNHQTINESFTAHPQLQTISLQPENDFRKVGPLDRYLLTMERNHLPVPFPLAPMFFYTTHSNPQASGHAKTDEKDISSIVKGNKSSIAPSGKEEKDSETSPETRSPAFSRDYQPIGFYRTSQGFISSLTPLFYSTKSRLFLNDSVQENDQGSFLPKPITSESVNVTTKERYSEPPKVEKNTFLPRGFQSVHYYRTTHGFVPRVPLALAPAYTVLSFPGQDNFSSMPRYLISDRKFRRESSSEVVDALPTNSGSQNVSEETSDGSEEHVPSETSISQIESEGLLPVDGFPFGVPSPSYAIVGIPNNPPSESLPLTLMSQAQPTIVQIESKNNDPVPTSSVETSYSMESASPAVSQVDVIKPVPTSGPQIDSQVFSFDLIPEEKPDATKIPYAFGFDMNDGRGNDQHREEISDASGVVRGNYGYRDKYGIYRLVNYIADENGFRAFINSNEPGVATSESAGAVVMADRSPPAVDVEEKWMNVKLPTGDEEADLISADSHRGTH